MAYSIERVTDSVELGEGPHWDIETQSLYYIDMIGTNIHRYKPSTNEHTKASIGTTVSFIIPLEGTTDKFLISMQRDIVIITWDGVSDTVSNFEKVAEVDTKEGLSNNRLNDGKADPTGILWTGTMDFNLTEPKEFPKTANLYSFNNTRRLTYHVGGIQLSNGLAWSADLKKFYYIDSIPRTIDQFDYDVENEKISNRTSIFSLEKLNIPGLPDGQAIDSDGNLWVAIFDGSRIIKIDPRRPDTLLQTIDMPASQVTSVAFGGENLDELYVTTARCTLPGKAPPAPVNGAVYRITGLGVKGLGGVRVKL